MTVYVSPFLCRGFVASPRAAVGADTVVVAHHPLLKLRVGKAELIGKRGSVLAIIDLTSPASLGGECKDPVGCHNNRRLRNIILQDLTFFIPFVIVEKMLRSTSKAG